MLVLNFVTFVVLYISFSDSKPVYNVSVLTRIILVIFSAFAMIFATLFYNAMYIFASENELVILKQKNSKLSADAKEDALTTLLNRRGFLPMIESLMKDNEHNHFCAAFCDLDNFKKVNDTFGHEAGDEVLKHVTHIIKQEMQGCDICRWGGEEIVILIKDCDLEKAKVKVENLRHFIEEVPTIFFNKRIPITVTIGLAANDGGFTTPEDVIKLADARMYYGKQHGKNVVVYEDEQQIDR